MINRANLLELIVRMPTLLALARCCLLSDHVSQRIWGILNSGMN